jgi:hypothetical protein
MGGNSFMALSKIWCIVNQNAWKSKFLEKFSVSLQCWNLKLPSEDVDHRQTDRQTDRMISPYGVYLSLVEKAASMKIKVQENTILSIVLFLWFLKLHFSS